MWTSRSAISQDLVAKREVGALPWCSHSGAAPATVSREFLPNDVTGLRAGKTGSDDDLRARRPAATPERPWAGCPSGRLQACRHVPPVCRPAPMSMPPSINKRAHHTGSMSMSPTLSNAESASAPIVRIYPEVSAPSAHAPPLQVIRRNGKVSPFDAGKISIAMTKAFLAVEGHSAAASRRVHEAVETLTNEVVVALTRRLNEGRTFHIEDVQDQVELALMRSEHHKVARAYVLYREERARSRAEELAAKPTATVNAPVLHVTPRRRRPGAARRRAACRDRRGSLCRSRRRRSLARTG